VSVAPAAISSYGLLLTTLFGRREEGYRFGQIALDLLNRFGSNAWMPRTYVIVYGPINTWVRPFRESLEPLRFAQQSALQSGDIEGSAISASLYFKVSLYTGMALKVAEQDATAFLRLMESLGQTTGVAFLLPLCSLFHDLSGTSPLDLNLSGSINSVTSAFSLAEKEGNKLFVSFSYLYRTMLYSLTGDHKCSLEAARNFRETSNEADFLVDFYEGLSSLALAREMNSTRSRCTRRRLIANGRQAVQRMTRYAAACPANFRNKQDLLRAELESTLSKSIRAISLYDESIQAAKAEGFVHEEALACERLANYHQRLGHGQAAQAFLGLAREAYLRWGAHTVAARVAEQTTSCKI
jgi:hypothetical protein